MPEVKEESVKKQILLFCVFFRACLKKLFVRCKSRFVGNQTRFCMWKSYEKSVNLVHKKFGFWYNVEKLRGDKKGNGENEISTMY